jgi:hypothetical protein
MPTRGIERRRGKCEFCSHRGLKEVARPDGTVGPEGPCAECASGSMWERIKPISLRCHDCEHICRKLVYDKPVNQGGVSVGEHPCHLCHNQSEWVRATTPHYKDDSGVWRNGIAPSRKGT